MNPKLVASTIAVEQQRTMGGAIVQREEERVAAVQVAAASVAGGAVRRHVKHGRGNVAVPEGVGLVGQHETLPM